MGAGAGLSKRRAGAHVGAGLWVNWGQCCGKSFDGSLDIPHHRDGCAEHPVHRVDTNAASYISTDEYPARSNLLRGLTGSCGRDKRGRNPGCHPSVLGAGSNPVLSSRVLYRASFYHFPVFFKQFYKNQCHSRLQPRLWFFGQSGVRF